VAKDDVGGEHGRDGGHDRGPDQHGHDHHGPDHHGPDHGRHDDGHIHHHRRGPLGWLLGLVSPHDHGAPSADRALESTADGIRAVFVSLVMLGATAAIELAVSLPTRSVALLADSIHNFADALTGLPLALAFKVGRRPPTRRYTYGFARAEDLAGLVIVVVIAASTAIAAYEAVNRLSHPLNVRAAGWVMAAGVVGFIGNEWVARYRVRVGRRIGSAALVADGLHARSDGFTSLAVVIGAVAVLAGAPTADPIVGLVITAAVTVVLAGATRAVYRRLMDSVDPDLVDQVENVLLSVTGVEGVDEVRIRWIGHELRAEIQVISDDGLSLVEAHEIAEAAHHRLLHDVPRLAEAVIHTSPRDRGTSRHHAVVAHHFPGRATGGSAGRTPNPRPAHDDGGGSIAR